MIVFSNLYHYVLFVLIFLNIEEDTGGYLHHLISRNYDKCFQSLFFNLAGDDRSRLHHAGYAMWYCALVLAMTRGKRFLSQHRYRMLMSVGAALLAFLPSP